MATIILKSTEKCNANCYYCDVVRKENTGSAMSLDVVETVFSRVDEFLKAFPDENVEMLWHGGEPLLLGAEYYSKAADMQDSICSSTKSRICHSMQTNLTCLNEQFIDVFHKLGIGSVGTSYDPEPHIRGIGKKINSDTYNRKFMEGISLLESHGIGWGMIYVVTKKSLARPLDVFYFLSNLILPSGFNMNPVLIYDDARKDIAISPEEYVEFLGEIFPVWWENRERFPDVQPFKSLVDTIINGSLSLGCVESGSCTFYHINVAPDGETSQCGRSADWGLLQYGNIADKSINEILHDKQREDLDKRYVKMENDDCLGCRFWDICHGGCPLDSYSQYKSYMFKSEWCESRRGFIEKYFEPITGVRYKSGVEKLSNQHAGVNMV